MKAAINSTLTDLASKYYISANSTEAQNIETSLSKLKSNLKLYFGSDIKSISEFGSYKRDTILPRNYDENSDVDLMIMFDHKNIQVNPSTYRKRLHEFGEKYYPKSEIYKAKPTVVLELTKIKYDLVPAYQENNWLGTLTTYIPQSDTEWMTTDPNGFNQTLTDKNKNNYSLIKPLIRLLKAWNAKVGYPLESFKLEKEVVGNTYFFSSNIEQYFFSAVTQISNSQVTQSANQKVASLKDNAAKVKSALENDEVYTALRWLEHIFPM